MIQDNLSADVLDDFMPLFKGFMMFDLADELEIWSIAATWLANTDTVENVLPKKTTTTIPMNTEISA